VQSMIGGKVEVKDVKDFRNYIVSCDKAKAELGFHPTQTVNAIVQDLIYHEEQFSDWDNPNYYNIQVLRRDKCALQS